MRPMKRPAAVFAVVVTALGFGPPVAATSAQGVHADPKVAAATWAEYSELVGSDTMWSAAEESDFGWSVAMSGGTAVVGAPYFSSAQGYHDEGKEGPYGQATGRAYVFTKGPRGGSRPPNWWPQARSPATSSARPLPCPAGRSS